MFGLFSEVILQLTEGEANFRLPPKPLFIVTKINKFSLLSAERIENMKNIPLFKFRSEVPLLSYNPFFSFQLTCQREGFECKKTSSRGY